MEDIIYPYSQIPVKFMDTKISNFKGVILTYNKTPHLWKWEDKIIYCYSDLFLPFARFNVPLEIIDEKFKQLQNIELKTTNYPFYVQKVFTTFRFKNQFHNIIYNENQANICVDYFQEEVRMAAHRRGKQSHWQIYKQNYKLEKGAPDYNKYLKIQDELWDKLYSCTEIPPDMLVLLVKFLRREGFKVDSVLDMSAGRGSRLTGAIACVDKYLGVDPNPLSHEWYKTQANYFCHLVGKNSENFTVLNSGFENAEIKGKFDIMFSSPPYFDLEIYSNDKNQSVKKFNKLDLWIEKFMLVSMKKIMEHLNDGGLMCINISNSKTSNDDWVNPLMKFAGYIGCILFHRPDIKHDGQPVFIWQKGQGLGLYIEPVKPWIPAKIISEKFKGDLANKIIYKFDGKNIEYTQFKAPFNNFNPRNFTWENLLYFARVNYFTIHKIEENSPWFNFCQKGEWKFDCEYEDPKKTIECIRYLRKKYIIDNILDFGSPVPVVLYSFISEGCKYLETDIKGITLYNCLKLYHNKIKEIKFYNISKNQIFLKKLDCIFTNISLNVEDNTSPQRFETRIFNFKNQIYENAKRLKKGGLICIYTDGLEIDFPEFKFLEKIGNRYIWQIDQN